MNLKNKIKPASQYFIFWSWNLIFVLLIAFLLSEHVIWPIMTALIKGATPFEQGIFALLMFAVPFLSIAVGVTKGFRTSPDRLLKLFFGVELPLFFLAFLRLFITSELQSAVIYLLIVSFIGIAAFAYQIFTRQQNKTRVQHLIEFTALNFSLLIGVYVGILLIFISVPILGYGVIHFLKFEWLTIFIESPLTILFAFFVIYTLTLFVGLPVMLCLLYARQFWQKYKQTAPFFKKGVVVAVFAAIISVNIGVFYYLNQQDQGIAFSILEKPITSEKDKLALLAQKEIIREGLINAYLKRYRYAATIQNNRFLMRMYADVFQLEKAGLPSTIQKMFNFVAAPFLFDDASDEYNNNKIAELYEHYFDASIEKSEREAIRSAMKSNWQRAGIEAGLIDTDQEKVWIEQQSIQIKESKHSAIITLQETYRNATFDRQEILYHFSLPAEAAITGVWLSDDVQDLKKYNYDVAPRGAAQKLYKQEVQRRIDPALMEQVGPYQYRLRIFPIPARTSVVDSSFKTEAKPMYLQLQYVVPLTQSRQWPMPVLLEKRNAFWTDDTQFILNHDKISRDQEKWLPANFAVQQAEPLETQTLNIANNQVVEVRSRADYIAKQTAGRYAVLLDTSYSMSASRAKIKATLDTLAKYKKKTSIKLDYFLVGEILQPVQEINQDDIMFYGNTGHLSHLKRWQQSKPSAQYSAIILITDDGAYELKENIRLEQDIDMPIWLLHVGNTLPYAYDDDLLDLLLKSKGGMTTSLENILSQTEQASENVVISGPFEWRFKDESIADKEIVEDPSLIQIAARQYIYYKYRQHKNRGLESLDTLHKIAKQQSIVTPFSSMIVLVNDQQKQDLKRMAGAADRFEREVESGRKLSDDPLGFAVEGVPEPEEWVLIVIVVMLLISTYVRRRKFVTQSNFPG